MEIDAQLWNQLLWSSMGKLELTKCGYHVIYYDFSAEGDPSIKTLTGLQPTIPDNTNNPIPLKEKNVFTPRKNPGHYKAPDGNGKTHIAKVMEKAQEISKAIHRTHSTRDESRRMYESVYQPAVEYILAQSFIPAPQLQIIAQKTMP